MAGIDRLRWLAHGLAQALHEEPSNWICARYPLSKGSLDVRGTTTFHGPFTFTDDETRLKTVADTDPIYYFTAFVKDHALVAVIVGIALVYLLLRVTRQR